MRRLALVGLLLAGCKVGPDYERPAYPVPETYRGDAALARAAETSFGDVAWFELFRDPALQDLIRTALRENYDVRIAAERVLEARARVRVVNADRYPDVAGGGRAEITRSTKNGPTPLPAGVDRDQELGVVAADAVWEIDFWGRVARATEAARAELLGTKLARRAVIQTLVADVAQAYLDLLELDAELAIARQTVASRDKSRELVSLRLEQGVANKVELRQAESLVVRAAGLVPDLQRRIEQQENLLRLLTGGNPGPIARGADLRAQPRTIEVPAGLPSELLERRPDVQVAEQGLVAANARIGEAKALLYPSIRLTGSAGFASDQLTDLFEGDSLVWSLVPSVVAPIFNAGRLRSNVEVTESQQRQAALAYLQTLQIAFRDVADSLVGHRKAVEVRAYRELLEQTLADQRRLSQARYRGGVTSYLEVLDTERQHFDAQLDLVRSVRDEAASVVALYRALGGGWQQTGKYAAAGPQEGASDVVQAAPAGD